MIKIRSTTMTKKATAKKIPNKDYNFQMPVSMHKKLKAKAKKLKTTMSILLREKIAEILKS